MALSDEIKSDKRKSIFKKIILLLIILWISYWTYAMYFKSENTEIVKEEKSFTVKKWDLKTFIEADWKVTLKDSINLDFINPWIIKKIYKKEWDEVKQGYLIAELDTSYLDINIQKAELSLDIAKSNYELKKRWSTTDEIKLQEELLKVDKSSLDNTKLQTNLDLQNTIDNLKIEQDNLENAKKQTEVNLLTAKNNLKVAEIDLQTSKNNLESIKKQENEKSTNYQNNLVMEAWQLITTIEKNLFDLDMLLWVSTENRDFNNSFDDFLWAKNTSVKQNAVNSLILTQKSFDDFYTDWKTYKINPDYNILESKILKLKDTAMLVNKTLNYTIDTLKYSISSYGSFSQETIDDYINDFTKTLSDSKSTLASFTTLIQTVNENEINKDYKIDTATTQVSSMEQKLEIAKANYDKAVLENDIYLSQANQKIKQANQSVESTKLKNESLILKWQSDVEVSKTMLDSKKQVDSLDLEPYYTAILTAQKNLEEAIKKKQDAELISPINWKIVNIEWKIWETTNSLKNPFVTIINTKSLFVESFVEESDIIKVKQNQDVYINFDSIEWLTMTWRVIYINEKANIDANSLVTYEVLIAFESSDPRVKDGMSTVIEFITKEIPNVLIIPVQSVKTANKKPSVKLESWEVKNIITWFTDWKMVEVVSWLKLGDKILY